MLTWPAVCNHMALGDSCFHLFAHCQFMPLSLRFLALQFSQCASPQHLLSVQQVFCAKCLSLWNLWSGPLSHSLPHVTPSCFNYLQWILVGVWPSNMQPHIASAETSWATDCPVLLPSSSAYIVINNQGRFDSDLVWSRTIIRHHWGCQRTFIQDDDSMSWGCEAW